MNEIKVIGIGGGIGSGKSLISHFFELLGFPVYNSDDQAKKIYYQTEIKKKVISLLGEKSYDKDGFINKKYIGEMIFSDKHLLTQLNEIIHPAVRAHFEKWCLDHASNKVVVQESALLFDNTLSEKCFKTILVDAPEEIRIRRAMKRDELSLLEVKNRLIQQRNPKDFYEIADIVLINDNNELLIPRLLSWLKTNFELIY